MGDETGIIKAFLWANNEGLTEGNSIVIFNGEAAVVKEHIEVQLMERGKVSTARREVRDVNKAVDISAKEWIEQA